jgi:hypothetical protein
MDAQERPFRTFSFVRTKKSFVYGCTDAAIAWMRKSSATSLKGGIDLKKSNIDWIPAQGRYDVY